MRSSPPTSSSTPAVGARRCRPARPTSGARAPIEEQEDCGFVYYGRHFRSGDGSVPAMFGPLLHGVRVAVDSHAAGRQRHVGRRARRQRQGRGAARAEGRRHVDADGQGLSARRALARRRAHRRRRRDHGQDRRPPPHVRRSTASRSRPACSRSPTRGRARTRRSAAASAIGADPRGRVARPVARRRRLDDPTALALAAGTTRRWRRSSRGTAARSTFDQGRLARDPRARSTAAPFEPDARVRDDDGAAGRGGQGPRDAARPSSSIAGVHRNAGGGLRPARPVRAGRRARQRAGATSGCRA